MGTEIICKNNTQGGLFPVAWTQQREGSVHRISRPKAAEHKHTYHSTSPTERTRKPE